MTTRAVEWRYVILLHFCSAPIMEGTVTRSLGDWDRRLQSRHKDPTAVHSIIGPHDKYISTLRFLLFCKLPTD